MEQVFCFENRGQEIGVTLHHPHGQIYAYPFVPARTQALITEARRHTDRTGRLLGADILAAERADGSRMVLEGQHWSAYVPYAARWPVEVHLAPHRDVPDLVALRGRSATSWPRSTSRSCGVSTATTPAAASTPTGCRTSPRGTRRRSTWAATSPGCTCS